MIPYKIFHFKNIFDNIKSRLKLCMIVIALGGLVVAYVLMDPKFPGANSTEDDGCK
jgi:hypothetical protein